MPTTLYHTQLTPTITATTAAAGYPASNLGFAALAKPWRGASAEANDINIDLGAVKSLGGLLLHDVNFAEAPIYTSVDGSTYTARGIKQSYADTVGRRRLLISLAGLNARYIRAAVNPAGNKALVIRNSNATVNVVNTATNTVVGSIVTGSNAVGAAVSPSGARGYVINGSGFTVIDMAALSIITTMTVAGGPNIGSIAINASGTRIYLTDYSNSRVVVIDAATNAIVATVAVGTSPISVAVNAAGTRVYVANLIGSVSVIDAATNAIVATVTVGSVPYSVAVNPAGTRVYTANSGGNSVSVIDTATNTVAATITVGSSPESVAVNPAGTRAYVVNRSGGTVSVIDTSTNTVVATVTVGSQPLNLKVNAAGTFVYVANSGASTVSVINTATNTVSATIVISVSPISLALSPDIATDLLPYWRAGAAYVMATAVTLAQSPNKGYSVQTAFPRVSAKLPNGRTAVATTGMPIDEIRWTFLRKYQDSLDVLMTQLRAGTVVVDMGLPQFPNHIWPVVTLDDSSDRVYPKANSESSSVTLTEVA